MSYFTLKNGEKLYYEDKGSGPDTLIMMHGWTSSHEVYEKPVELLQDKARCIIYDHRGHKGSKDANGVSPITVLFSASPKVRTQ
jgi:pimeloyl-ACP methyl ester carboxylesterase